MLVLIELVLLHQLVIKNILIIENSKFAKNNKEKNNQERLCLIKTIFKKDNRGSEHGSNIVSDSVQLLVPSNHLIQ